MKKLIVKSIVKREDQTKQWSSKDKSAPVPNFIFSENTLELKENKATPSITGRAITFEMEDGTTFDVIYDVSKSIVFPASYFTEFKADAKPSGATDKKVTDSPDKKIAGVDLGSKKVQSTSIGAGVGLIAGFVLKRTLPCCGNTVMLLSVLAGGFVGFLMSKEKTPKPVFVNVQKDTQVKEKTA